MNDESKAFGVSIRGWLTLLLTITVCLMSAFDMTVQEPIYTLVGMAMGWYFGQKEKGK
jgi:hypothetical protein